MLAPAHESMSIEVGGESSSLMRDISDGKLNSGASQIVGGQMIMQPTFTSTHKELFAAVEADIVQSINRNKIEMTSVPVTRSIDAQYPEK